jgi:predicted ATPase
VHRIQFGAPEDSLILTVKARPPLPAFDLLYLGAERLGPRELSDTDSVPDEALRVGSRGEFTAQVLARHTGRVREALCHPATTEKGGAVQLIKQAEFWMQEITPEIEIRTVPLVQMSSVHALQFKRSGVATDWLRPPNIGFGVSYALPIVVGGLLAAPGSLFLVENPEAHLHPQGQSHIGRFLAHLATAGVQVIVETHSDHVLNGVRLAAADPRHPIRHDQVIVQHFHSGNAPPRSKAIELTEKAGLSAWPVGFFDQSERDLAAILKTRRG